MLTVRISEGDSNILRIAANLDVKGAALQKSKRRARLCKTLMAVADIATWLREYRRDLCLYISASSYIFLFSRYELITISGLLGIK